MRIKNVKGKKKVKNKLNFFSDLAGARTQDPLLKREMLYQLSYQVVLFTFIAAANIKGLINITMLFQIIFCFFVLANLRVGIIKF